MEDIKAPLSRAFFLELVLVFAIFTLTAVICLQVFAAANKESERSKAQTELGIAAQQLAENFKINDGKLEGMDMLASAEQGAIDSSSVKQVSSVLCWYYDDDLNIVAASEARFILRCDISDSKDLKVATITLTDGEEEIFKFDASKFVSSSVGADATGNAAAGNTSGDAGAAGTATASDAGAASTATADTASNAAADPGNNPNTSLGEVV